MIATKDRPVELKSNFSMNQAEYPIILDGFILSYGICKIVARKKQEYFILFSNGLKTELY